MTGVWAWWYDDDEHQDGSHIIGFMPHDDGYAPFAIGRAGSDREARAVIGMLEALDIRPTTFHREQDGVRYGVDVRKHLDGRTHFSFWSTHPPASLDRTLYSWSGTLTTAPESS